MQRFPFLPQFIILFSNQNALGLFSDDGATFSSDSVSSSPGGGDGSLSLQAHAGQYWYTVLGDCLDASGYTHLQLAVRYQHSSILICSIFSIPKRTFKILFCFNKFLRVSI